MKRSFAKLTALLLMLAVVLTGCNLLEKDPAVLVEEEKAKYAEDYATVLAEYDGGKVTKFDIMASFYNQYSQLYQMYAMFGMELDAETMNMLVEDCVNYEVETRVMVAEFDRRGMTLEQPEEEILAEADAAYQSSLEYYMENVEGETEAEKKANAELSLYMEGFTPESLRNYYLNYTKAQALQLALQAEVTEVTDEELQALYELKLAEDEEYYTTSPTMIENDAADGSVAICWKPEGYRTVKHVLAIPEDAVLQAVTDARTALETAEADLEGFRTELDEVKDDEPAEGEVVRTEAEIQADIDAAEAKLPELKSAVADAEAACLASVSEWSDAVYAALAAGEDIDAVMAEYGEDPGMQNEPSMTTGYYVREDSTTWDSNFTAGAMALNAVGEYSAEPVISGSGVHIIYYWSDVTGGPVPFEEVQDTLYNEALEDKAYNHFNTVLEELKAAVNPVYHYEGWQF